MDSLLYPFLAALAVMFVSLSGVIFASGRLGAWMNRYLTYLATFSGGVFIVIAYFLAEEAVHEGGWVVGVGSVVLGAAIMEGVRFFFPQKHHHHGPHEAEGHGHTPIDGRQVLWSDALHNVSDGVLLVGAFASNVYVGLAATLGVVLHETVQEISEYFVLREAGYSNRGALLRNFAVSSSILLGFIFAAYLSSMEVFLALLSGIAAGGFLSVILHDLLPHAIASVRVSGGAYMHILAATLGLAAMLGVQGLVPHEHEEHEEIEMHMQEGVSVQEEPNSNVSNTSTDVLSGDEAGMDADVPADTVRADEEIIEEIPETTGGAVPNSDLPQEEKPEDGSGSAPQETPTP